MILPPPPPQRVDFFDGLRGWAAVSVLLLHIGTALYGGSFEFTEQFLAAKFGKILFLLFDGQFAVYIFFVLSGVVLSLGFMRNPDTHNLTGLVIRRIPRLGIPVLCSTIIIFFLMKFGLMHNLEAAILNNKVNGWLKVQYNFIPTIKNVIKSVPNVFLEGDAKYNFPLWTMRWEFLGSYYLVIFLLAIKFSNVQKKLLIWILSTIVLLYFEPVYSAFSFGIFVSFVYVNKNDFLSKLQKNKYVQIGMIVIVGISYELHLLFSRSFLLPTTAFLIVLSLTFVNIFQTFFSCKVSRFLGKISFPLYIVHMPIICSFTSYLMVKHSEFMGNPKVSVMIYMLSGILALIIACCFYPVEKLSIWFSKKTYEFIAEKGL